MNADIFDFICFHMINTEPLYVYSVYVTGGMFWFRTILKFLVMLIINTPQTYKVYNLLHQVCVLSTQDPLMELESNKSCGCKIKHEMKRIARQKLDSKSYDQLCQIRNDLTR